MYNNFTRNEILSNKVDYNILIMSTIVFWHGCSYNMDIPILYGLEV